MTTEVTTITDEREYKSHSITVTAEDWKSIKAGRSLCFKGEEYAFESESFWGYWTFNQSSAGSLLVEYGDDEGFGFDGMLNDVSVEEHRAADQPTQATVA